MTLPRLQLDGISRSFGGIAALRHVDLELAADEILGLIGPNGSGKSTLLSIAAGRRRPSAGRIRLDGRDVTGQGARAMCRAGVGCTFQLVRVAEALSALDNVAVAAMYGRRRLAVAPARAEARRLLERVQFAPDPATIAGGLTYFDQKRVELARALATDPEILLLDEWLAGLTPTELAAGIALIHSLHQERRLSMIVVEHVMAAIRELCGRIVVLGEGVVVAAGSTAECLANPAVIEAYLGQEDA